MAFAERRTTIPKDPIVRFCTLPPYGRWRWPWRPAPPFICAS